MAVIYPLVAGEFMALLPVKDVQFALNRSDQIIGLRGGDILTAERMPPYWGGTVTLGAMASRASDDLDARLEGLQVPGRAFEVYHPHRIGPASDPFGLALAGFNPVIEAITGDGQGIRLGGLPQDFRVQPGDLLSFDYDPRSGARRAFHRIREERLASAASAHSGFALSLSAEVSPHVRPGWVLGAAVRLVRPALMAVLVPGSIRPGVSRGGVVSGKAFDFRQKLRV